MTRARELADLLNGGQTITTDDNSAVLKLKSTDADASAGPGMDLVRDSGSPADDDIIGYIRFRADNDAGDEHNFCFMQAKILDASDGSEDAGFELLANKDGTNRSRLEVHSLETVFNEDSVDVDFRVEGNGNANMFFVDAGNNKVGVGTNTPAAIFSALSTSGTTTDIGRFEAAVGSYTGTSLVAGNTLGAASTYNLFKCITDSDADAGGPVTQFLVRGDGKVGIGEDSPLGTVHIRTSDASLSSVNANADDLILENNGNCGISICSSTSGEGNLNFIDNGDTNIGRIQYTHSDNKMGFRIKDVAAMELEADGSNRPRANIGGDDPASNSYFTITGDNAAHVMLTTVSANGGAAVRFKVDGNVVGQIGQSTTATTYGTSSDYRLKENVADMTGAIARVKQLAPKRFNFIADADTTVDGFLAHEAQAVVPEAITGTHNEVDEDNDPIYQQIDQSKLVPLLTGALQEAIAEIETLKTKVAALEAE